VFCICRFASEDLEIYAKQPHNFWLGEVEMGQHALKTTSLPVKLLVGVLALLVPMTAAFVIGIVVAFVMQRVGASRNAT
jgi:hypothetical protein